MTAAQITQDEFDVARDRVYRELAAYLSDIGVDYAPSLAHESEKLVNKVLDAIGVGE